MRSIKVVVTVLKLNAQVAIAHQYDMEGSQEVSSKRKIRRAISRYIGNYGESCVDDRQTESSNEAWAFAEKAYAKYFNSFKR